MTEDRISLSYVTYIRTTPDKVLEAVTKPDLARQFWGHENVSDWKLGSRWQHVRADNERTVELIGEVIEISSPKRLVTSWANASQADDPEAYSRVTYEVEAYEDMARLTVTHDLLVAGSGMAIGVSKGWPIVLSSMKSFLETGKGLDVFARPKAA